MGLARALEITEPATLQAIEAAALLHDTGKLAIPEHILNKPGKLTSREFEVMKTHVTVGADILSSIDFPYPVVPIVRAHHENWDGSGYPNGLRGEAIPIGARILSVVDCFDALTSDRPYRPAMTPEAAFEIILQRRGAMYDPAIVDTFVRVYPEIEVPKPQAQLQVAVRNIQENAALALSDNAARAAAAGGASPSDDLLAFVSLARLTSGSPTVADIGAFAWSQLRHLAPEATMALFALDESKVSVVSQHVEGPAARRLEQVTIGVGDRISGWVAANSQPMTDADGALDLGKGFEDIARFALSIPLTTDGGLVGVLTLYRSEPFGHQLGLTIEMIGPHLAKALAAALATTIPQRLAAQDSAPRGRTTALSLVSSRLLL
jgi:putative nucleotidyltransferase with HDIG domain